jgi:hypothetical protein
MRADPVSPWFEVGPSTCSSLSESTTTDVASFFLERVAMIYSCDTPLAPSSKVPGIRSDRISAFDASMDVCPSSVNEVVGVDHDGNSRFRELTFVELAASFLAVMGLDTSCEGSFTVEGGGTEGGQGRGRGRGRGREPRL